MPRINNNFNQSAYNQKYVNDHYKKITAVFKFDEAAELEAAANNSGMTKSQYIKTAVLEKIERESE